MQFQQILWITTKSDSIRSDAEGWGAEDGSVHLDSNEHVGSVLAWSIRDRGTYSYPTVRHAMSDGWHVMCPPTQSKDGTWEWWLTRSVNREPWRIPSSNG